MRLSLPAQQVAALLGLVAGEPVAREALATKIWPDSPSTRSRFYLRRVIVELKACRAASAFTVQGDTLALNEAIVHCGLSSLVRKLERFRQPLVLDEVERSQITLPLLDGHRAPWLIDARTELASVLAHGLLTASHQRLSDRQPEDAIDFLRIAIAIEPYREQLWRALFRALASAGNHAEIPISFKAMRRRLASDLDLAPSPETDSLVAALLSTPSRDAPSVNRRQFPLSGEPFVGRDDAVSALESLGDRRMLTIVGVGGIGKTRLASFLAEKRAGSVYWFSMGIASAASLFTMVAETFRASDSESALLQRLKHVAALFVIDNAESASATDREFLAAVLQACPGIDVLATSRELLRLPDERPYYLQPVGLAGINPTKQSDAFALFFAYLPDQNRELTKEEISQAEEICECLGGVPLALKLAALKTRSLSLEGVLSGLQKDVRLIDGDPVDPAKSIRAAYEWSFTRLSPEAQRLFTLVSPLTFAWPQDLVEEVGFEVAALEELVLSGLVFMVDKEQYRSANPLRQFALRRFNENAETSREALDLLVSYFESRPSTSGRAHESGLRFAAEELIGRGLETDRKRGLKLAETLVESWEEKGDFAVAASWIDERLTLRSHPSDPELARLFLIRARCATELYDLAGAIGFFERGIASLGERDRNTGLEFEFRLAYSNALSNQEAWAGAEREAELALGIARALGNKVDQARAMQRQAYIAGEQRQFPIAYQLLEETLRILLPSGETERFVSARETLAVTLLNEDRIDEAEAVFKDCDAHRLKAGQEPARHWLFNSLGDIANRRGDYASAIAYADEALSILSAHGHAQTRVYSLQNQAKAYAELGEDAKAIELLEEVVAITEAAGMETSRVLNLTRLVEIYMKRADVFTARAYLTQAEDLMTRVQAAYLTQRCEEFRRILG